MQSVVSRWFGLGFQQLHPLLQSLHLKGGTLIGPVEIEFGRGLARPFGKAIARRLGIPLGVGPHSLRVDIRHQGDALHWNRCFDGATRMDSIFQPTGAWPDGLWLEQTGPLRLGLAVEVSDGGWHWRCRKAWLYGIRLPRWLFPRSDAYKCVVDGQYRFQVTFAMPLLGVVLGYGGLLESQAPRLAQ